MFKFLVISILLWQKISCVFSTEQQPVVQPGEPKSCICHGTNIHIYSGSSSACESSPTVNVVNHKPPIKADYNVTDGNGAHYKLYSMNLPWNEARRTCVNDGAQLAIIRSDFEQSIIVQMMTEKSTISAWLGAHDIIQEGEWLTVLGEHLKQVGWAKWSRVYSPNPDNYNNDQDCAYLMRDGDGMDDLSCQTLLPFVCKISTN